MDDKILSLQLWDTAGQERFQSVTKAYYRGAHGVMLMYDVSQEESFIAVKSWINSIQVCASCCCLTGEVEEDEAAWPTGVSSRIDFYFFCGGGGGGGGGSTALRVDGRA